MYAIETVFCVQANKTLDFRYSKTALFCPKLSREKWLSIFDGFFIFLTIWWWLDSSQDFIAKIKIHSILHFMPRLVIARPQDEAKFRSVIDIDVNSSIIGIPESWQLKTRPFHVINIFQSDHRQRRLGITIGSYKIRTLSVNCWANGTPSWKSIQTKIQHYEIWLAEK